MPDKDRNPITIQINSIDAGAVIDDELVARSIRMRLTCSRCGYYPTDQYGCRRCGSDPHGRMMRT